MFGLCECLDLSKHPQNICDWSESSQHKKIQEGLISLLQYEQDDIAQAIHCATLVGVCVCVCFDAALVGTDTERKRERGEKKGRIEEFIASPEVFTLLPVG